MQQIYSKQNTDKTHENKNNDFNKIACFKVKLNWTRPGCSLFSIIGFSLTFFSQLILTNRIWDNPPVVYLVAMGPVGVMKLTRKLLLGFPNLVSSPGPAFVKVKARLGQVGD